MKRGAVIPRNGILEDLSTGAKPLSMYTCDVCGEEFETLSGLRLEHDPCPVERERRRREETIERLRNERGLEIGEIGRVIATGEEVEIVDVEPGDETDDGGEPTVVWIPAGADDEPENRRKSAANEVV